MCKVSLATYQCAGEGVDPLYNTQLARKHILSNLVVTLNDPTVRVYFWGCNMHSDCSSLKLLGVERSPCLPARWNISTLLFSLYPMS